MYPYPLKQRGLPFIQNYGPTVYKSHSQGWGIAQAPDGRMYFGNGYGILEYDGTSWVLTRLPSKSLVRSMAVAPDDRVYTGAVNVIGYLEKDNSGQQVFYSLADKLPKEYADFREVRNTIYHDGKVFYQSFNQLMVWHVREEQFKVFPAKTSYRFIQKEGESILLGDNGTGLMEYQPSADSLALWPGTETLAADFFRGGILFGGGYLIVNSRGLWFYQPADGSVVSYPVSYLPKDLLYSGIIALPGGGFAIRSPSQGVYFYSSTGELELHLTDENGLSDHHTHDFFIDREGAMWVTHNMGISRINLHLPFHQYDKRMDLPDIINDVLRIGSRIFVSTHTSTFYYDEEKPGFGFTNIFSSNIESFALEQVGKWLIVTTSGAVLKVDPVTLQSTVIDSVFSYKLLQSVRDPSLIVYNAPGGLRLLRYNGKEEFAIADQSAQLPYSIRFLAQEPGGMFWIGTNDNKVVVLDFFDKGTIAEPHVRVFDQSHGLPASQVAPCYVHGAMLLGTQEGIFEVAGERVIRSEKFADVTTMVPHMQQAGPNNALILSGFPPSMKILTYARTETGYKRLQVPELDYLESTGLWLASADIDSSFWISTTNGVLHYQPQKFEIPTGKLQTFISQVTFGDSVVIRNVRGVSPDPDNQPGFPFSNTALRFLFSLPSYNEETRTDFSYRLSGYDSEWSQWSATPFKEYDGLSEGNYTFSVKGRSALGLEGAEASYSFSIYPPWYRSKLFLICVALFISAGGAYVVRYFSIRKLRRRVEELEFEQKIQKERERISSDLHDHVGAQLTSIIAGLQITEQIDDFQFSPKVKSIIDSLKEDASQTMTNLRDSIWSLRSESIALGAFCEHVESYVSNKLRYFPQIAFTMHVNGGRHLILSPKKALNLLRVLQESLQNVLKHAEATNLTLNIAVKENTLTIALNDNGKGFDTLKKFDGHYGLENMKLRLEEVDGKFSITSEIGQGTTMQLEIETEE